MSGNGDWRCGRRRLPQRSRRGSAESFPGPRSPCGPCPTRPPSARSRDATRATSRSRGSAGWRPAVLANASSAPRSRCLRHSEINDVYKLMSGRRLAKGTLRAGRHRAPGWRSPGNLLWPLTFLVGPRGWRRERTAALQRRAGSCDHRRPGRVHGLVEGEGVRPPTMSDPGPRRRYRRARR
jgi:hypothetical protein